MTPTIDFTDDELAAAAAAIRPAIEDDRFPHRGSIRCARCWKVRRGPKARFGSEGFAASQSRQAGEAIGHERQPVGA